MDSTLDQAQIDLIIQQVWPQLSDEEKEQFLSDIKELDIKLDVEIKATLLQTQL